jgi:hypothetical protein
LRSEFNAEWGDVVRAAFGTPQYRHAEIHKAIFNLDCRIVVS